jgi:PKD repeat protein
MRKSLLLVVLLAMGGFFSMRAQAQIIQSFPYNEDFESFATCGTGCGAVCPLAGATGWTNDLGDNLDWSVDVGGTSSSSTGPSVDHNPGNSSSNYLYVETSCSGTGYPSMTANLISPPIDLSGANGMQMEFWWHMFGTTIGTLHVDVSTDNGSNWSNDIIPAWTDNQDLWQMTTVDLSAYSNDTVLVRIRQITGSSFGSDGGVDDFTFFDLIPADAGIARLDSPSTPACNLGSDVWVTIENYGTDSLFTADVDWSINATPQTQLNWAGILASGESETFLLGSGAITDGDFVKIWTSMPNGVVEPLSGSGNDTIAQVVQTGLAGIYTIGTTGDYLTFNDAMNDLNQFGVCSAVIFNVEDGTYNEQMTLNEVAGMSGANTVHFQSQSGDPSLVTLWFAGTNTADNFVVNLDGGDNFHFHDLTLSNTGTTFGTCVLIGGGATSNMFGDNIIMGDANVTSTSSNMALVYSASGSSDDSMNWFNENEFLYGSYGMYYYGNSTTDLENGTRLTNNNFTDFYYRGVHMYYQENMEISGNTMRPGIAYTGAIYRIYVVYGDGAMRINNNRLQGDNYGYSAYLSNCDATIQDKAYIYNNFMHVGDPLSTSTSYGIYLTGCNNQVVTYNSVNMESAGTTSRCLYATGGNQNRIMNNVFTNDGPGYGIYLLSGVVVCDNNNTYVPNGVPYYSGSDIPTLNQWQNLTGYGMMSDTLNPLFFGVDDLHTCQDASLDMTATPDTLVLLDIDGQPRDPMYPDMGADEFLGLMNYTIGDTMWKCSGDGVALGGAVPQDDATYLWSNSETTASITTTIAGTYSVLVTTTCGSVISEVDVIDIPDALSDFSYSSSFLTAVFTNLSLNYDSVMWDFGDGNTSTMEDPIHIYATGGVYNVTLTAYGPCGTDVFTDTYSITIIGTEDVLIDQAVSVYPNPNNGNFSVSLELDGSTDIVLTMLSVEGKQIWTEDLGTIGGQITKEVSLENQTPGIYFLQIAANGQKIMKKIVVQ